MYNDVADCSIGEATSAASDGEAIMRSFCCIVEFKGKFFFGDDRCNNDEKL
jgi:hypothetical protein